MSFLPKTAQTGHQVLDFVIALPLTILATGLLFVVVEIAGRAVV